MSETREVLFSKEEKKWKKEFTTRLQKCLKSEELLRDALNTRASIISIKTGLPAKFKTVEAMREALAEIDTGNTSEYALENFTKDKDGKINFIGGERVNTLLLNLEINIKNLPLSEKLLLEAAITKTRGFFFEGEKEGVLGPAAAIFYKKIEEASQNPQESQDLTALQNNYDEFQKKLDTWAKPIVDNHIKMMQSKKASSNKTSTMLKTLFRLKGSKSIDEENIQSAVKQTLVENLQGKEDPDISRPITSTTSSPAKISSIENPEFKEIGFDSKTYSKLPDEEKKEFLLGLGSSQNTSFITKIISQIDNNDLKIMLQDCIKLEKSCTSKEKELLQATKEQITKVLEVDLVSKVTNTKRI